MKYSCLVSLYVVCRIMQCVQCSVCGCEHLCAKYLCFVSLHAGVVTMCVCADVVYVCVEREALRVGWVCSQLCSPSCTTSSLTCRLSCKCLLYFLGELVGHIFCQPLETTKADDAHGVFPGLKGSRQTPITGSHATSHV